MAAKCKPGAAYYAGAHRDVFAGVPIRLARKPGRTTRAMMVEGYREPRPIKPTLQEARRTLEAYADALGISLPAARRRVAAQAEAVAAAAQFDASDLV